MGEIYSLSQQLLQKDCTKPAAFTKMAVSKKTQDERHPLKNQRLFHKMAAPKKTRDEKKLGMSDI
jgi:hypothetical protein